MAERAGNVLYAIHQTPDASYVLAGSSTSDSSGDKTEHNRDFNCNPTCTEDYWIVKTDSMGNKQWDKTFGGYYDDGLRCLYLTSDGGYLLGGTSCSDSGADKTQNSIGASFDYWIIKTDSAGNKQWDKDFGGTRIEYLNAILQAPDKGYLLGGCSYSNVNGSKSQPNWDTILPYTSDYWIFKTDSAGHKKWDKDFGGTDDDMLYAMQQTADGGYILGGWSSSGIGGNKTQASWGGADYWIIKTDSLFNIQWDRDYGGSDMDWLFSILPTADGGYLLAGISASGISGDKTQASWGYWDYWIVKTDSLGNKQWDKDYGGTGWEDDFGNVLQTADGGYLFAGSTYSQIGGNKTENNLGMEQTWIWKTDFSGNIQWDKTIFTNGHDEQGLALLTKDGCYTIGNFTDADTGGYKTQSAWSASYDYWIIKFCDSTLTTSINQISNFQFPISISPNPFTDELTVTFQKQNIKQATFTVKNILGQTVFSLATPDSLLPTKLDLSFLTKGIYFLEATIDGERTVKKIVKQ